MVLEENRYYYVDEAGDFTFFNKEGRIVVGKPGASKFFMVGVAQISDPEAVTERLEELRRHFLVHPRFKDIPSMQPKKKKTAIAFHAKDDHPEIRLEVFKLIRDFDAKVFVAIKRKQQLAISMQNSFKTLGKKSEQNEIYDDLIKRLFKNLLHKADRNNIVFAHRGKRVREEALNRAILKAKTKFQNQWKINSNSSVNIQSAYPSDYAGLQVIDYFLWAVQRLYERHEDQYFNPIAEKYRLIMDIDDRRNKRYGEWYCDKNPLTLSRLINLES